MTLRETLGNACGHLAKFLAGDSDKALLNNEVNISTANTTTRTAGAGEIGKVTNKRGGTVVVNNSQNYNLTLNLPDASRVEEVEALGRQILEAFQRGDLQLVRRSASEDLDDFQKTKETCQNDTVEYFRDKLDPSDFCLLQTGYYIRSLVERGDLERALRVKESAVRNRRARNIINLASEGYFDNYIRPIFESNELEVAREEYEEIVQYMPEIVFVNNTMSSDDVVTAVLAKVAQKEKYHLMVSRVMAHGIGTQCAQKIEEAQEKLVNLGYEQDWLTLETVKTKGVTRCKLQLDLG